MSTHKLTKGQLLYREKRQRYRETAKEREIESVEIDTIGSKYFTVREEPHTRFLRATLRDEYQHYPALRLTAEEIAQEWERATLQRELKRVFEYQGLPLKVLQQIAALVPEQLIVARQPLRPPS